MSQPIDSSSILIVDDVPSNLQLLSNLLTEQGYKVYKVLDGMLALRSVNLKPPDLILLDIMMPGIDGYEVCSRLKADPNTQDIPIIFLSARDDELGKVRAFDVGGVDYITKPFQVNEVLARVKHQIQIRQLQRQLQLQNLQLQQEVSNRTLTQMQLEDLNQQLEIQVGQRTVELAKRNEQLLALQARLEKSLVQEQSLNTLKSQLIATVSHEFNTPLATIQLICELQKNLVPPQYQAESDRYYRLLVESINRILQVVEDTKLLAQGEAEQIQCCFTVIDLAPFCHDFVQGWQLPHPNHSFHFIKQAQKSPKVLADPILLNQVLKNLITNAIRYSPQGGTVQITVDETPMEAIVQVKDSGIGIPEAEQTQIFERFYRASNADSVPGTPGAGLGLAVVKHIVERHHGDITIDSVLGEGTCMTLHLPIAQNLDSALFESFGNLDCQ